ncbi:DUF2207 domain-containing protein [Salinibacterium soli]|uniref:DUF2207 domain-containing protein n=1 Tax=Antiquaquibacter soli TaxID=3064523 RepID=A0ABT9BKU9_9MICO|nr:DUF2207 domain-containing protein [Protaetiibacter sp. WY-16]MDO7881643.1 DUF2207 domain-containing protein [Protaetiibacter sp. WY-16]
MKPPRLLLAVAAALLALPIAAAPAAAAPADVDDFSFDSFSGEYYLDIDESGRSTLRVVETIVARFPEFDQNRGIVRAIPTKYGDVNLGLSVVSVTDESGAPVPFERGDYGDFAELALGTDEFVHGRTTYVIEYTMRDVVRNFADTGDDEFYWDINGDGWGQEFGSVSASIHLSAAFQDALTGSDACFLGVYGEVGECELEYSDGVFSATVTPVGPYNTLTVAIGFDGGTVVQPTLPRDSWIVTIAPLVLLGLGGVWLLVAILVRFLVWRHAKGRGTVIAQFEPPADSDLLLDAELLDRRWVGLPALFIDFAVRGMVKVIDLEPGGGSGTGNRRFQLELATADGATAREKRILVALFGKALKPGSEVNPGSLTAAQGASLYSMGASSQQALIERGYLARPDDRLPKWIRRAGFATVLAFAPIWVWAGFNDVLEGNVVGPAFGTVFLWIVASGFTVRPLLRTRRGGEAFEYLQGLREYLTVAEEARLRMLQSPEGAVRVDTADRDAVVKLNERLLPYAVLWGVEDRWVEVLRAANVAPAWVEGTDVSASMLSSFRVASTSSVRPIVTSSSGGSSSWSSSSSSSFSSGSSGGGFSGGGGGGGGGGGR